MWFWQECKTLNCGQLLPVLQRFTQPQTKMVPFLSVVMSVSNDSIVFTWLFCCDLRTSLKGSQNKQSDHWPFHGAHVTAPNRKTTVIINHIYTGAVPISVPVSLHVPFFTAEILTLSQVLLVTWTMALQYSSVPVRHESETVTVNRQHKNSHISD